MVKEQFTEYNGIKIGDTIKITTSLGQCYTSYEDWLNVFNFDDTRWHKYCHPDCDTLCTVLGIAKHLEYGRTLEDTDVLFYVDDGKYTYIMSILGIELYESKKKEKNRNSYIIQGKTKIYYIID